MNIQYFRIIFSLEISLVQELNKKEISSNERDQLMKKGDNYNDLNAINVFAVILKKKP